MAFRRFTSTIFHRSLPFTRVAAFGTAAAATPLLLTSFPTIKLFGIPKKNDQPSTGNDVRVEYGGDNGPRLGGAARQVEAPPAPAATAAQRSRTELDDLLDSIFGERSGGFDPIDQLSKTIPRAFWPEFFSDLVEEHGHKRFSRDDNGERRSAEARENIEAHHAQLLDWLHHLAPAHSSWWDWTAELSRPFHLGLEDNGNNYAMRVGLKGLQKDEVKVRVQDGVLSVIGGRRQQRDNDTYRGEAATAIQQSIRLPPDADKTNVRVKFDNGALLIMIPKRRDVDANGEIRIE